MGKSIFPAKLSRPKLAQLAWLTTIGLVRKGVKKLKNSQLPAEHPPRYFVDILGGRRNNVGWHLLHRRSNLQAPGRLICRFARNASI
ncbi:hypothetical protein Pan181_13240 [Aeoliella mucimassa]|uniref:Uncharacterized protein n=1 Tax=Aeoliella mucimassa TaxID=2527972 RepID=A0A518AK74_9BACT|nr:hypothetical protein Pan181_13240 [Aeoliella mucimassa]